MIKIKLLNASRKYIINKTEEFYALKNVTLVFDDAGFVSIVGKSGSGKSTLLNLLTGLDKATSGNIYIDEDNIAKQKASKRHIFYKNKVGILFQSYNLIEDETALFNVMLPSLIKGEKQEIAKEKAKNLLSDVGVSEELQIKKSTLLSGGEKQRVALARTLINSPSIIMCDEPTGALDSKNSISVMNILKKYSENHLVIMVSHNLQLVKKYSDRIIEISEGRIISDKVIKKPNKTSEKTSEDNKKGTKWINHMSVGSIKKHLKRNVLSFLALTTSLIFSFLSLGYVNGKDVAIDKATIQQFDFGVGTVSKEEQLVSGNLLSLTRTTRPDYNGLKSNTYISKYFEIAGNFDAIVPQNPNFYYDGDLLENLQFVPIYAFSETKVDKELIVEGRLTNNNTLFEVIINDKCRDLFIEKYAKSPLGETIRINSSANSLFVDFDGTNIVDNFTFDVSAKIVAVVKELNYLKQPRIYYSYSALESYLDTIKVENLSTYNNRFISWKERILTCENYDALSSYSYRLFPKDVSKITELFDMSSFPSNLKFTSSSLLVRESLINFMDVAKYGLILFLVISLIGTFLILGIMSFTSYSEDHKKSAILSCLGADANEISMIYLNESLLISFGSLVFSIAGAYLLSFLVNHIINKYIDLNNLIVIPLLRFHGVPFLFPLICLLAILLLSLLSTLIPIIFSKRISLKEELQSL